MLPPGVDPDVIEALLGPARPGREPHPVIEAHGSYVFGVLVVMSPRVDENHAYQEIGFVATPERLVTVRRSSSPDVTYDVAPLHATAAAGLQSACSSIGSSTTSRTRTSTSWTPSTPISTRSRTRSTAFVRPK